jgi:nicotinate phosphoribosyltransferase
MCGPYRKGRRCLPNEPLLRIEAPLWQAQIAETYLLNVLNYQTLIATRAARIRRCGGANNQAAGVWHPAGL